MNCSCHDNSHSNCIKSVPIFKELNQDEMLEIAHITSARTYKKGEMVYMAGNEGGTLFVLHTGRVKIFRLNASGKEQVIRIIGPGEFMGELSLFSSVPLTDNAEVLEASTMCVIEGKKLKELMAKYPSIAFKVMEELSRRLEKVENLVEAINLNTVEQRVAQELLALSDGQNEIVLNMTKGDLASQIGMSQETLSRKLASFQEEGLIIQKGHRKITIKDREALEQKSQA
ncbi:MAG: Crp/Fnr family transcriptional regulator [Peptococcia bacterium]